VRGYVKTIYFVAAKQPSLELILGKNNLSCLPFPHDKVEQTKVSSFKHICPTL